MTEGVFVSYRRDDAPGHAGRLYDRLVTRFGVGRVFMDVDSIEPGEDFVEAIESTLAGASVVVVVIGPTWVTARDEDGVVRLTKPDDFVHLEVSRALQLGKRVIPVLVDDALVPEPRDLPEDLRALARRNAIEISDGRFHSDADRLADAIDEMMASPTTPMPVVPITEPATEPVSAVVTEPVTDPVAPVASPPTAPEPVVTPPPGPAGPGPAPEPVLVGRLRRIGWPVVAAVVVALVMVIGALAWALSSGDDGGTAAETTAADNAVATSVTGTTVAAAGSTAPATTGADTTTPATTTPISPAAPVAPSVAGTIPTQGRPVDVLVAGGTLWAAVEGGLERFAPPGPAAPAVGRVELGSPGFGNDLIVWDGVLYVTRFDTNALAVVDLVTGALRGDPIPLPGRPLTGAIIGDTLWLAIHGGTAGTAGAVVAIRDRAVVDEIPLDERPYQIEAVGDRLWVTFAESDGIALIDPAARQATRFAVGPEPVDVRLIGGLLWVTVSGADQVALVDPASGAVTATIPVGDRPWKVVDAFGAVWVSNYGDGQSASSVMRIDPAGNTVGEPIAVGVWPDEMAVGTDALFVGNFGSRSISVIDPGT